MYAILVKQTATHVSMLQISEIGNVLIVNSLSTLCQIIYCKQKLVKRQEYIPEGMAFLDQIWHQFSQGTAR